MEKRTWLWHYTTINVFSEFMKDDSCLYATHYKFLNDSSEGIYILDRILRDIATDSKFGSYKKIFAEYIRKTDFYVTCFSKQADSLYQWRSYTPQSGGIAIAFALEDLEKTIKEENDNWIAKHPIQDFHRFRLVGLQKCKYQTADESYKKFIEAYNYFKGIAVDDYEADDIIFSALLNQVRITLLETKDPSFALEDEMRLIYSAGNLREDILIIGQKPRIETCIRNVRNYIREVKISPHGPIQKMAFFVELLRDKYGISFPITFSNSNYTED